ncbi:MAG: 4-diphosphocytidyl-2-C-methyl-D-erythritol kinase [Clostridia bacterium]|jgi:4-diphosphocytidyl-2-C-methyl-D-erythritol kinase|nr:4-(cytidine 5-diphospho)-2-C-methyl-D-erythritol kinase [Clostridiales bacterium]MDK2985231.1 4-diphosphocytidyl-2-C-methyl-D-erythritol kinase [Clostridia bacterium]
MEAITIPAYAKINLLLDIVGKRQDGYHLLKTVMQNLALCDYISLEKTSSGIAIETTHPELPTGRENLAYKAAEVFFKYTGIISGVKISITKNIPVAAGLAGGSSNAAAVLTGLNTIYKTGLTPHKLASLGARLGADVPFCVIGGTVLAEGIGEKLTLLPSFPRLPVVLVKPDFGVSTAAVYRNFNLESLPERKTEKTIVAFKEENFELALNDLENVLETVTCKMHPEVAEIKLQMQQLGSRVSLMCGSGPTVFCIAKSMDHAEEIAAHFKKKYREVYATYTI